MSPNFEYFSYFYLALASKQTCFSPKEKYDKEK